MTARAKFLSDLIVTAIEHRGYGFPGIITYAVEPKGNPRSTIAIIFDRYEDPNGVGEQWTVNLDTMARGLQVVQAMDPETHADWVRELQLADRTNGEDGGYDVNGALLVLECALFGEGTYV